MAGQKIFNISKDHVLTHFKGVFIKETSKINKIWVLLDYIKGFRGPHLACGPYIVNA